MKWIVLTLIIGMVKFSIPLTLPMILKYVVDELLGNPALTIAERVSKLMTVIGGGLILFVIVRGRWSITASISPS